MKPLTTALLLSLALLAGCAAPTTLKSPCAGAAGSPCDRADERDYRKVFGLSQREFELVREWEPEERLALVKHGNDSVVVRTALDSPEVTRFLPVLSGNEGNVRRMREIIKEVNSQDPELWLPIFMERAK